MSETFPSREDTLTLSLASSGLSSFLLRSCWSLWSCCCSGRLTCARMSNSFRRFRRFLFRFSCHLYLASEVSGPRVWWRPGVCLWWAMVASELVPCRTSCSWSGGCTYGPRGEHIKQCTQGLTRIGVLGATLSGPDTGNPPDSAGGPGSILAFRSSPLRRILDVGLW